MRGLRYDCMLAGTALVLALVPAWAPGAFAQSGVLDVGAPMPAPLPPPTAADLDGSDAPAATNTVTPATAPTAMPDPLAALDPADRPIAEKIRDLLAAKADRIFANKKERSIVEAFYQNRNLAPLWIEKGVVNARAKAVISRLQKADTDGLEAKDYRPPNFDAAIPDALAEAELRFTATVLTYARHLQAGRFPYWRVGKDIEVPQVPPEQADVLNKVAADGATALEEFSPPHAGYKKLKAKLAELRGSTSEEEKGVRIPEGPLLRPGMDDARVPLLRQRLNLSGDDGSLRYDPALVAAVKAFQKGKGGTADGVIGASTVRQLNGATPPRRADAVDTIVVNMERWRWLPRDLGRAHVMVNIPDFTLRVIKNGDLHWTTRIVVGKPNLATPILAAQMKYITVNPTWNVPPSIIQNEYLPALQQDPTALDRMGLKVVNNRDGTIHIYQPPGDGNALGRVRFNFPNRFLVYQHDTPDKNLFSHESRAYSHGCMRVQDPPKYAEVLLNIARPTEGWTAERIRKMYGSAEVDIQFPTHIPVNLTYQTAFVDDDGKLQTRRDIYGIDGRMQTAIKSERGIVETVQERPREPQVSSVQRPRAPEPRQAGQASFFESLFGGGRQQTARPAPPNRIR